MKKKFTHDFNTALGIAEKYELNDNADKLRTALAEIPDFKVTAPVIGGFSTGKSSLINAVIGENLLSTNITPETAVPTEITYGDDTVTLVTSSGAESIVPLADFDPKQLAADKYSVVRIRSSNVFFAHIPSIKLVDMPGFDSGIDVHNKAIDNYLPASLAYILTVSADEGTLRASIISFLNELKLYDMPVYTVITKANKAAPEAIEQLKAHIAETVRRFLKIDDPKVAVTIAKGKVDVDGFNDFLMELQSNSDDIFNSHFAQKLDSACGEIEKYLTECCKNADLTLDDLKLQKEQAERAFMEIGKKFDEEKQRFDDQVERCISVIKSKIASDLNASVSTIEGYILQNQETAIKEKINSIIRTAYTLGIQTELEPRVKKYITNVENAIQVGVHAGKVEIPEEDLRNDTEIKNTLINVTQTAAPAIGAAIGTLIAPGLGTAIGLALGTLATLFINLGFNTKQKAQKEQLAKQQAQQIINSAAEEAGNKVAAVIYQYKDKITESLNDEIKKERELREKSLTDCEEKLALETEERERRNAELKSDIDVIRGIRNGI